MNKDNDWATCLTVDQLKAMWGPDSKAASWKDIDPSFPDESLKLYGPGTDSGTFDFFTAAINGEGGASRSDYSPSEDDNVTVQGVSGEKGGLGYFGLSYYEQNQDTLKAARDRRRQRLRRARARRRCRTRPYTPLSRPLFVYVKDDAAEAPGGAGLREVLHRQQPRRSRPDGAVRPADADAEITTEQADLAAALTAVGA